MPASSVFVNGKTVQRPGVYPTVDASAIGQGNAPRGDIAIVGEFPDLAPATLYKYGSASALVAASPNNKDFARLAKLAFIPGIGGGAKSVTLVNAKAGGTAAAKTFLDDTSGGPGAADSLTLTSKLYGQRGNSVWYQAKQNTGDANGRDFRFTAPGFKDETYTNVQSGVIAALKCDTTICTDLAGANDTVVAALTSSAWQVTWSKRLAVGVLWTNGFVIINGVLQLRVDAPAVVPADVVFTVVGNNSSGVEVTKTYNLIAADQNNAYHNFLDGGTPFQWSSIKSVNNNAGGAQVVDVKGDAYNFDPTAYASVADICTFIDNNHAKGWFGTIKSTKAGLVIPAEMDKVASTTIKGAEASIRADLWACVQALAGSKIVTATRAASAALPPDVNPTITAFLTGGGDGTITEATDYPVALNKLRSVILTNTTVFTSNADAQTALKAHLLEKATVYGKPCNGWVGAAGGASLADLTTRASLLNDRNITLVGDKIRIAPVVTGGTSEWLDPKYLAVLLSGAQAGSPVGTPMTEKNPDVQAISHAWTDDSDEESVIAAGVCGLYTNPKGVVTVLRSVTTSQANEIYAEESAVDSLNYSILDLTETLRSLIGQNNVDVTADTLEKLATARLLEQQEDLKVIKGFANVKATAQGDGYSLDVDLAVIRPVDFITVTAHLVP